MSDKPSNTDGFTASRDLVHRQLQNRTADEKHSNEAERNAAYVLGRLGQGRTDCQSPYTNTTDTRQIYLIDPRCHDLQSLHHQQQQAPAFCTPSGDTSSLNGLPQPADPMGCHHSAFDATSSRPASPNQNFNNPYCGASNGPRAVSPVLQTDSLPPIGF